MSARVATEQPGPIAWAGWYSIDSTGFWSAWWTAQPTETPWREPDATGEGKPEDAERAIRAVKGIGAFVRMLGVEWAEVVRERAEYKAQGRRMPRANVARKRRDNEAERRFTERLARDRAAAAQRQARTREDQARADAQRNAEASRGSEAWWRDMQSKIDELLRQYGAPKPAPQATPAYVSPVAAAFAALDLTPIATTEEVARAFRRKVGRERLHPDQGGNVDAFVALNRARELATKHATGGLQ